MVEPRHQPITPLGRYSGIKEPPVRSWDRNKARIESIYQLPTRDFRQTAAQFGVPPSLADLTMTDKGIPKMECTTTTKSDFCRPSLDRYLTVPGVCPNKDYPSSSGLDYCPGRLQEEKPPQPVSTPVMPRTRSTCPASMSSLLPNASAVPKLNYPLSVPQYPSCSAKNDVDLVEPLAYSKNHSYVSNDGPKIDYTPKVDYFSKQPDFKWPAQLEQASRHNSGLSKQGNGLNFDLVRKPEQLPKPDFQGGGESVRNHSDYSVETDEHAEKRRLHDANMDRARLEYEKLIGSPASTVPLMKAGVDPPSAVAHYNVPDYTQGATAGGLVRPRFGAPNLEMKVPITDPSYPKPEHKIPLPEAGLTKMTYSGMNDDGGKPGVAYTPPVRYPDKIHNAAPEHAQAGNAEVPRQPLVTSGVTPSGRYVPSIIEAQESESKLAPNSNPQPPQPSRNEDQISQPNPDTNSAKTELPSLKGLRRIQTTNQVYGSWIDDPYLKDNDWWFRAKAKMPLQKTYLSRYAEENKWH